MRLLELNVPLNLLFLQGTLALLTKKRSRGVQLDNRCF